MKNVLTIITEVEFVQLYNDQPLFGDISSFLSEFHIMFHKFLSLQGRTLKPTVLNNDLNHSSQHMWSDAMYIRDVQKIPSLNIDPKKSSLRYLRNVICSHQQRSKELASDGYQL